MSDPTCQLVAWHGSFDVHDMDGMQGVVNVFVLDLSYSWSEVGTVMGLGMLDQKCQPVFLAAF